MVYYIEPKLNRAGNVVGYSNVKYSTSRAKSFLEGKIEIDMNGIKFSDYEKSPKSFYISGTKLTAAIRD